MEGYLWSVTTAALKVIYFLNIERNKGKSMLAVIWYVGCDANEIKDKVINFPICRQSRRLSHSIFLLLAR